MVNQMMLAVAVVVAAATSAGAASEDEAAGRYRMETVGGSVLRFDRVSGEIALCEGASGAWACDTVVGPPSDETAPTCADAATLAGEAERLAARVALLERRLARIAELAAVPGAPPADAEALLPPSARRGIDEAAEATAYAVRRFRDLLQDLADEFSAP